MFKLVCGAGNEDTESVKRLVFVYASAGCNLFDLSARKEILDAAKEGGKLAGRNDIKYCVSIGIKGDKHISKAYTNPNVTGIDGAIRKYTFSKYRSATGKYAIVWDSSNSFCATELNTIWFLAFPAIIVKFRQSININLLSISIYAQLLLSPNPASFPINVNVEFI